MRIGFDALPRCFLLGRPSCGHAGVFDLKGAVLRLLFTLVAFTSAAMAADVAPARQFTVETSEGTGRPAVVLRQAQGQPSSNTSPGPAHPLFIGIRGAVLALDRTNGQEVWRSPLKGKDFVNVVLENGDLYAATLGEIFCLDPGTGRIRWHTQIKGLGRGLVTIAGNQQTVLAAKTHQEQEAGDAAMMMLLMAGTM